MRTFTDKLQLIAQIFITFLKISPVTFGGGYAMIPLIEREVVQRRGWVKSEEITDIFAVAESVPGAIAINSATFIGYRLAGVVGAIAAMVGVMIPTFCIVLLLSIFFLQVQDHPKIEAAFISIRATIVALITYAALNIGKTALIDKTTTALIVLTVPVLLFVHLHPVLIIISGGLLGIAIVHIKKKLGMKVKLDKDEPKEERDPEYYFGDGI